MNRAEMTDYVSGLNPAEFPYACAVTGELTRSLWQAIHTTIVDLFKYRIIHHWMNVKNLQEED